MNLLESQSAVLKPSYHDASALCAEIAGNIVA